MSEEYVTCEPSSHHKTGNKLVNRLRLFVVRTARLWKFGLVGGGVAVVGSVVLYVLIDLLGVEQNLAYFVQACISLQLNFIFNDGFTWKDRRAGGGLWRRWFRFHLARVVSIVLNQIIFALLALLGVHPQIIYWLCIIVVTIFNFYSNDRFVFVLAQERGVEDSGGV